MKIRDIPENMSNSPDFVKVMFDERGNPLGIKPLKGSLPDNNGKKLQNIPQKPTIQKNVEQEVIVTWISNLSQNIKDLREGFRLIAIFNQKKFDELGKIIAESSLDKSSPILITKFKTIENEISNLKNQYNLVLGNMESASKEIKNLAKKLETMEIPDKEIFNQLDSLNASFSNQIDTLKEKMEGMKLPDGFIYDQLNSLDLRLSTITKEIADTKMHEIETSMKLKSFVEDMEICKMSNIDTVQKLSDVQDEISKLRNEIVLSKGYVENTYSEVSQKMSEFSSMNEELDFLRKDTEHSINELSESQNQLLEKQRQMESLFINQENISRNLANDAVLKIKEMLKKPKRMVIKPTKAKVVRFLKKNFKIKPFSKVLVVTDKRNSIFGKTLYEATRRVSKKSVLAVMENRTDKMNLDKPVVEAIKKSNYVFIVGKYSLKKVKELSKNLKYKVKIVSMRRTLNYSTL